MPTKHSIYETICPLVLASGSPRRKDFFQQLGLAFESVPSRAAEPRPSPGESPGSYATRMAEQKGLEVLERCPGRAIVAADTVVALNGLILGKPADHDEAVSMLTRLCGHTHQVVTGCWLHSPDSEQQTFHVTTDVRMRAATPEELHAYVATGEPADKAGAYAIQGIGSFLVEHVHGSYTNVVGLPLARVLEVLVSWGVIVPKQII